jgi:molybdate transport system substrate-binding protein
MDLHVLCAGAARGLVRAMEPALVAETGAGVQGSFGAVGAMKEKLLAGEPCDVIVLTAALIDELAADGRVERDSVAPLGRVGTGVAVRTGEPLPGIVDGAALAASLRAAAGILFPDPARATAGIHFVGVLKRLGIYADVEPRLRTYPNGATAMRELAQASQPGLVGCTQITEINYTPGVTLVGALPAEYALSTVYSVAVCTKAVQPEIAWLFADLLAGPASAGLRAAGGFESPT